MKDTLIIHQIAASIGSTESSELRLIADTATGEVELVISKTITERYPITDYEKVKTLHDNLNRGGGRKVWTLEELTR